MFECYFDENGLFGGREGGGIFHVDGSGFVLKCCEI